MQQALPKPVKFAWLFGARTDLLFFYAPILFGCVLLAGQQSAVSSSALWAIVLLNALGAGPFHQGATWLAYFDRRNREEFSATAFKRFIFFAAPFLIFFATVAIMMVYPLAAILIFFFWSLQHIVSQNIGILLLYHNHNSDEAVVDRSLEIRTQVLAALTFGLLFFYRAMFESAHHEILVSAPQIQLSPFTTTVVWLSYLLPVVAAIGLLTVWSIGKYFYQLNCRLQEGKALNVPSLLFWLYSIASLCPLALLGKSFEEGNLIPSTVHWFQYIAINYVLVRNRGSAASSLVAAGESPLSGTGRRHSSPLRLFFLVGLLAVVCVMGTSLIAVTVGAQPRLQQLLIGVVMGFGGVHYFLDAYLWRFREPSRRQAVLPYLLADRVKA
jgi:hypothetical protein